VELFESNFDWIYIGDINNKKSPKLEVSLNGNFPFYLSIWNVEYIFLASDSVPKSLEIAKDNIIERCNNMIVNYDNYE
jgi:hypothetical protein